MRLLSIPLKEGDDKDKVRRRVVKKLKQLEQHISSGSASGASESEIYIWDLSNPGNPMSPGNKLHPLEDISCVAWNRQAREKINNSGGDKIFKQACLFL